jgi:MoxR-like ATPase
VRSATRSNLRRCSVTPSGSSGPLTSASRLTTISLCCLSWIRSITCLNRVRDEIGKIIVGQQDVVDGVLICLLAGGHVLARRRSRTGQNHAFAHAGARAAPEIFAHSVYAGPDARRHCGQHDYRQRRRRQGPAIPAGTDFRAPGLADEINRATPKTQSALLEAMQEHTVTSGTTTHELEAPFLVMATQNPIEMEGNLSAARGAARPVPDENPGQLSFAQQT